MCVVVVEVVTTLVLVLTFALDIHPQHYPPPSERLPPPHPVSSCEETHVSDTHAHMHLSTCILYKHLSTFTLGIHPQHPLSS